MEPRLEQVDRRTSAVVDVDVAFARARHRLVRIATSLVGPDAAEDIVQETYLIARDRSSHLRDPDSIESWLVRICIRRAFRVERRRRRLGELLGLLPRVRHAAAPSDPIELHELIERLPGRERAVVVLQHGYGYSLAEVAELVGVSHANARQIASRTRARLMKQWLEAER